MEEFLRRLKLFFLFRAWFFGAPLRTGLSGCFRTCFRSSFRTCLRSSFSSRFRFWWWTFTSSWCGRFHSCQQTPLFRWRWWSVRRGEGYQYKVYSFQISCGTAFDLSVLNWISASTFWLQDTEQRYDLNNIVISTRLYTWIQKNQVVRPPSTNFYIKAHYYNLLLNLGLVKGTFSWRQLKSEFHYYNLQIKLS